MEDKIFGLIEKMYSEMQNGFQQVNINVSKLQNDVLKIQMELENNIKPTQKLILEELVTVKEKLEEHDIRFDTIESKIESQDVEIKVLKRAK
jgi:hypothetical protein